MTVIWSFFIGVVFVTVGKTETRKEQDGHLTCFYCHTLTHSESCNTINTTQHNTELISRCSTGDKYCTVRRFSFSLNGTDSRVWMMERNCSRECTNECIITGDRSKLHLCISCCQSNLCNFGNGASARPHSVHIAISILSLTLLCLIYREQCET